MFQHLYIKLIEFLNNEYSSRFFLLLAGYIIFQFVKLCYSPPIIFKCVHTTIPHFFLALVIQFVHTTIPHFFLALVIQFVHTTIPHFFLALVIQFMIFCLATFNFLCGKTIRLILHLRMKEDELAHRHLTFLPLLAIFL